MIRILVIALGVTLGAAGAQSIGAESVTVYEDSLSPGWQNWSWDTTVDFDNETPVYGTAGRSVAVELNTAWAGLYLHTDATLNASEYETLSFAIYHSTGGVDLIRVVAYDAAYAEGVPVELGPVPSGSWAEVEIPVASFGLSTISGLVWQDVTGAPQPVFYLDDVTLVAGESPPPGDGPGLTVDGHEYLGAISPLIYGMNSAAEDLATDLDLPVRRLGGNHTTRYNWLTDTSNRGSDWFFENIPYDNADPGALPDGSHADRFVEQDRTTGTATIITLPLIGWTPKARAIDCGFSVALYGAQNEVDPYRPDCGNGIYPDDTPVVGNDPLDTSNPIDPTFVEDWIAHLVSRYGTAAAGGVQFYNLDNEPMLWNSTHRDVHPQAVSYDELRDRTLQYAAAVKAADPTAATLGPVAWGWSAYFYSAADVDAGGAWWETRPDRMAHGDVPFTDWYLQQMAAHEQTTGDRLLDYLDLHFYPQASGVALGPAGDAATRARRLRSTRALWDPTYVDESWIADSVWLLPRMREWVDTHYPGTKLAITEYNWGGLEHINGALTQADVLGIFGREGLDLATLWSPPAYSEPGAFAFRMYRNYDGSGSKFGETALGAASADQDQVSIYAALSSDNGMTIILINKATEDLTSALSINNFAPAGLAARYSYSGADLSRIIREEDLSITSGGQEIELPASSITLLVVPQLVDGGDFDGDGDVDLTDFSQFQSCFTGPDGGPIESECIPGDLDGDDDVDCDDWVQFVAVWSGPSEPPSLAQCGLGVPTASEWGVVLLTLLTLTAGTMVFHRNQT